MNTVFTTLPDYQGHPLDYDYWDDKFKNKKYNSWDEVINDPELQDFSGKIELDKDGKLIFMTKPSPRHNTIQSKLQILLRAYMGALGYGGHCPPEPPVGSYISQETREPDAVWASYERTELYLRNPNKNYLPAPEICVEVKSPRNARNNWAEIFDKKQFYFDSDAMEVWICDQEGKIGFYEKTQPDLRLNHSILIPDFPVIIPESFEEVDELLEAQENIKRALRRQRKI